MFGQSVQDLQREKGWNERSRNAFEKRQRQQRHKQQWEAVRHRRASKGSGNNAQFTETTKDNNTQTLCNTSYLGAESYKELHVAQKTGNQPVTTTQNTSVPQGIDLTNNDMILCYFTRLLEIIKIIIHRYLLSNPLV